MPRPFEITNEEIERLDDRQLTDLLRRLLHLEAAAADLPASSVGVSLKINVSDGGEDGRIEWEGGPETTSLLPNRITMFQCKATDMPPSECKKEVLTANLGGLKPQVMDVLERGGSYILFHNRSLNRRQKTERIKKFREAISSIGKSYAGSADIRIYDANLLADWANRYVPAIVAVSSYIGRSLPAALLTWDNWNRYDQHTLVFVSSESSDAHIKRIRSHFDGPGRIGRIVGLSGLGKTRLALEAFRPPLAPNIDQEQQTLSDDVVYLDAAGTSENLPGLLIDWRSQKMDGLLVVDNCDPVLHRRLTQEIEHADNRISLLTLDYNKDKSQPGQFFIELGPAPFDVIKKMLGQAYPDFLERDIDRIVNFAEGFPQMAVLFAQARLSDDGDIVSLNDDELVKKLLWGRETPDQEAYRVATALAVFEHVGFRDDKATQREYISERICQLDRQRFYEHARRFIDRGILEERGRFVGLKPRPLALRLAAEWWTSSSPEYALEVFVEEKPPGMSEAMSDQLAKLHYLTEAKELVRRLCVEGGYFSRAEVLDSKRGSRLFRSLVEVNPIAATDALVRVFGSDDREHVLEVGEGRFNLTTALEKLCFWKETFPAAAPLLLAFAAGQDERGPGAGIINAANYFLQLFHVFLSGTQVPPSARLRLIKDELNSPLTPHRVLAVRALGDALKTHSFSRGVGVEMQGSRMPLEDWSPKHWSEVFDYWRESLDLLSPIASGTDELADLARQQITNNIRGLVGFHRVEDLNKAIRAVVEVRKGGEWSEAAAELQAAIRLSANLLKAEERKTLLDLLNSIQPQSLTERLRSIVSLPLYGDADREEDGDDADEVLLDREVRAIVEEFAGTPGAWVESLPAVLSQDHPQAYEFGYALGKVLKNPEEFINDCLAVLLHFAQSSTNLLVLRGFLAALQKRDPKVVTETLDRFAEHETLRVYTPTLSLGIKIVKGDVERLLKLVEGRHIHVLSLRHLANGQRMAGFTPNQVITICDRLIKYGVEGAWAALDILNMYTHGKQDKWSACSLKARQILLIKGVLADTRSVTLMRTHTWMVLAKRLLKEGEGEGGRDDTLAEHIATEIVELCAAHSSYEVNDFLKPVLRLLLSDYRDIVWPILGKALISTEARSTLQEVLVTWPGKHSSSEGYDFFAIERNFLLNWAGENPERGPSVLASIAPLADPENKEEFSISPLVKDLLDRYGDIEEILSILEIRIRMFSWEDNAAPHYHHRIVSLKALEDHPLVSVSRWARNLIGEMERDLERESLHYAERRIKHSHY